MISGFWECDFILFEIKIKMVLGVDDVKVNKIEFCESCINGKLTRWTFVGNRSNTKRILEVVHTDVAGPITPLAHDGR